MDPDQSPKKAEIDTAECVAQYLCRLERYPLLFAEDPAPARTGLLARAAEILGLRRTGKRDAN